MNKMDESLRELSWDDLSAWAGGKILERGKSYVGRVHDLRLTEEGELVAWVAGTEDYISTVEIDDGELFWFCTCPYDIEPCKHAVALVLAGLEEIKAGRTIPPIEEDDERLLVLYGDDEEMDQPAPASPADKTGTRGKPKLLDILAGKSREELLAFIVEVASSHPEVERKIIETDQLDRGKIGDVVKSLRREIDELARQHAWYDHWRDEGNVPDYSHVRQQLAALLDKGHADCVVELGEVLWEKGLDQVEESNDDGDVAWEIANCMEVVFEAVGRSRLSPAEQIIWMVEVFLEDAYAIVDPDENLLENERYGTSHWAEAAGVLEKRLDRLPVSETNADERQQLLNWVITAYERSGSKERIIPLLEKEAPRCRSYKKLVDLLLEEGRIDLARKWCIEGYEKTVKTKPGIAATLQKSLRDLARQEKRFDLVAAYRAQDFFSHPSRTTYSHLRRAAEAIGLWQEIREKVLHFLKSGERPDPGGKTQKQDSWPLPRPEVGDPKRNTLPPSFPDLETLIDIAILEKRADDVVSLYKSLTAGKRWHCGKDDEVATAVIKSHPDLSLAIWRQRAESRIKLVKPKAYEEAAVYLRKMLKVYRETGRMEEWMNLIADLRTEHRAKRRLLEVLDALENKKIVD